MNQAVKSVLKDISKKICFLCGILCIIFYILALTHWILGFLFGTFISLLNFLLMGKDISVTSKKVIRSGDPKISRKLIIGYFFRYVIIGMAFIIVVKYEFLSLSPFVIGLFMVHISLYLEYVWGGTQYADD